MKRGDEVLCLQQARKDRNGKITLCHQAAPPVHDYPLRNYPLRVKDW